MYFVFEYAGRTPIATIVAQSHPEPWVQVALGRLGVPYDATRAMKPRWGRVRAALDEGSPPSASSTAPRCPGTSRTPRPR